MIRSIKGHSRRLSCPLLKDIIVRLSAKHIGNGDENNEEYNIDMSTPSDSPSAAIAFDSGSFNFGVF